METLNCSMPSNFLLPPNPSPRSDQASILEPFPILFKVPHKVSDRDADEAGAKTFRPRAQVERVLHHGLARSPAAAMA